MTGTDETTQSRLRVSQQVLADVKRRFSGFDVPDVVVDPAHATEQQLKDYGLPPRPVQQAEPLLRAAWHKAFGKPLRLQRFTVDVALIEQAIYHPSRRTLASSFSGTTRFEDSQNWSGAYITANHNRQFMQVWGGWRVPANLQLPPGAPPQGPGSIPYVCANWIGLDGQRRYFNSSLPQMGTAATLTQGGTTVSQAWIQWWADDDPAAVPVPLAITVNPGDEVVCVITAFNPQLVLFVMCNITTSTASSAWGEAPSVLLSDGLNASPAISGTTAEWIMERPRVINSTDLNSFPDYGHTAFDLCLAVEGNDVSVSSLAGGEPQILKGTRFIRMFQVLENPGRTSFISVPRKTSETSIGIHYGDI